MNNNFWHVNRKQYEGWRESLDNGKIPTHWELTKILNLYMLDEITLNIKGNMWQNYKKKWTNLLEWEI